MRTTATPTKSGDFDAALAELPLDDGSQLGLTDHTVGYEVGVNRLAFFAEGEQDLGFKLVKALEDFFSGHVSLGCCGMVQRGLREGVRPLFPERKRGQTPAKLNHA